MKEFRQQHPKRPIFGRTPLSGSKIGLRARSVASAKMPANSEKCEESEKPAFSFFQLERAAAQFVPNKIGDWVFSDFPKNFRGYMWGV